MSLTICHGHPHPLRCLDSAAHGHEVIDWSGSSMPAPCSVPPFLEGKLCIQHFEPVWRKTSFQIHKLYTKRCLFGMKKRHPIVGAAVKHKAQLTALARLTGLRILSWYLTHLTTHPPHFIHYSTAGSGATRTCTGMGFVGLASVSH